MSKTKKDLERMEASLKSLLKIANKQLIDKDLFIAEIMEKSKDRARRIMDLEDELIENEDYIFTLQNTIIQTQIKKYSKHITARN